MRLHLMFISNNTISWSLIPGRISTLETRAGVDEMTKSRVHPDAGRVGSITCRVSAQLSIYSSRDDMSLHVSGFVVLGGFLDQSMSPRFRSPDMMIFGWLRL